MKKTILLALPFLFVTLSLLAEAVPHNTEIPPGHPVAKVASKVVKGATVKHVTTNNGDEHIKSFVKNVETEQDNSPSAKASEIKKEKNKLEGYKDNAN